MNEILFPRPSPELRAALDELLVLIDKTFPLPSRFRAGLGRDVAELSRLLTSGRDEREDGYMGRPALKSAYLRYFLPWNVYRLSRLLPALPLSLADGDAVLDLGSGPLTVAVALWLSRPELRGLELEFRCLDRNAAALEAGKALFAALAARSPTKWRIKTIRGSLGTKIEGKGAALVVAANLFNELFWNDRSSEAAAGERYGRLLASLGSDAASILVVEPGIPRSSWFISALRASLLSLGRFPIAPCPHDADCPLPGGRRGAKWCHFAFDTEDAPAALHKLSAAAGIPKERATLGFIYAGPAPTAAGRIEPEPTGGTALRLLSDAFPVADGRTARYACTKAGLALVEGGRRQVEALESGTLLRLEPGAAPSGRDPKTGCPVFLPRL